MRLDGLILYVLMPVMAVAICIYILIQSDRILDYVAINSTRAKEHRPKTTCQHISDMQIQMAVHKRGDHMGALARPSPVEERTRRYSMQSGWRDRCLAC